jgi:hypothetical protein
MLRLSKGFLNILQNSKFFNLFFITFLSIATLSISADASKFYCLDGRKVDKIDDCDTEEYKLFVKELFGESYLCDTAQTGGKVFKCPNSDKCVAHTLDCGCPTNTENWNGFCYPKDNNPIKKVDSNKITCMAKIKINNHETETVKCDDGTCRAFESECNTQFECPIGYMPCGVKCILLNETCNEKITCSNEKDVLCWDYTCASSYDECPTRVTCPKNKVLCPDGSCQDSGHCPQPKNITVCEKTEYQCPNFDCQASKNDCVKNKACQPGQSLCEDGKCQQACQEVVIPTGKYRCPNGDYVDDISLCSSVMILPTNYVNCPLGGIAINNEECKFVQQAVEVVCPTSKPLLCPDFACVTKSEDCSKYIPSCPPHKPYKCWNNECRALLEECPTPVTCPKEAPILCQNGLCVKSKDQCTERGGDTCSNYRCYDGTCVTSMELCPTHKSCGEGNVKCWNGACVSNLDECRLPSNLTTCPSNMKYRCSDGSCRKSATDCSTISVCPPNLPIKCWDNSCRASLNECPNYQLCGENRVPCPDGTCAVNFDKCNTVATCLSNKPYLCYDHSCKAQLSDCPQPPQCSKTTVLCPNGACMSNRQNCKIFDPCDQENPIRCEMNTCTDDSSQCSIKTKRCPIGYIMCTNGDCKTSEYLCDNFECPKNKPYLCKEGVCVHDKKLCDKPDNGCPYNAPKKCPNGTCVKEKDKCAEFKCGEGLKKCDDGSCIEDVENSECPLFNGCYRDRPFKCADGSCINPETSSCPLVFCPINYPFRCPNGYCVAKSSDCPTDLSKSDLTDCGDGLIMCVDGRCVPSSDYCRPAFECETGYSKCPDGTCRVHEKICPNEVACPKGRFRCPGTQICVKSEIECTYGMICPDGYFKCPNDGLCVANQQDCESTPNLETNGCANGGVKCPNGRCMSSLQQCASISSACPDDKAPYLCKDGECAEDAEHCGSTGTPGQCQSGKVRCPTGRCVADKVETKREQCSNNIGCPLNKPYRCSNGQCVENEKKCDVTTITQNGALMSNIACDVSKPYLCSDRTCVSDPSFCKSSLHCPTGTNPCYNGFCVKDGELCNKYAGFCPISNPVHCPSGTCVDDYIKCATSFPKPTCTEGEFYCARTNECLTKKVDCFVFYEDAVTSKSKARLLLENFVDPLSDEEFINTHKNNGKDVISLAEEGGKSSTGKVEGKFCYDGSIISEKEKCPTVPACKMGEFRCENGGCATELQNCPTANDIVCGAKEKKCPDGLCHKDCSEVPFDGCDVGLYQCTNGLCVQDKYDCIGHSMCQELLNPFRCINGECRASPEECGKIERLGTVKPLAYSFNKLNKIQFNFAYDVNRRPVAKIDIPGSGLNLKTNYSKLYISDIPTSILQNSDLYNNSAEFLYNVSNSIEGSEGILTFENSVMSPVFKFYNNKTEGNIKFDLSGTINIAHNEYDATGLFYYDYCLAKLNNYNLEKDTIDYGKDKGWECVERQTAEGQTEFQIKEFGVYAVILNPSRIRINYFGDTTEKNFFLENVKTILIVFAVIIVLVALIFYIFVRVTRYRQKYHENRTKILLLQQQKQEYENMTTDIFGQTLGDNINGIVYKANPAYTTTNEIKKSGTSLEEEIENLQIECRNVNDQNERLQKDIADLTEQYKVLTASIENMNK